MSRAFQSEFLGHTSLIQMRVTESELRAISTTREGPDRQHMKLGVPSALPGVENVAMLRHGRSKVRAAAQFEKV